MPIPEDASPVPSPTETDSTDFSATAPVDNGDAPATTTEATNVELELMRLRLASALKASGDPYEQTPAEPSMNPRRWVALSLSLCALFLVAYFFAQIMRDAIQSQPVSAGLEEDVLQGQEEIDATVAPTPDVVITIAPN